MTMPHLENCHHRADGWCGDCVKQLGTENMDLRQAIANARREARADGVTTRLFAKWCGITPTKLCQWTYDDLPNSMPDFLER